MAINLTNALGIHPAALQLRIKRAEALAGNIAHADTPGYLARDFDFRATLARAMEGQGATTPGRTSTGDRRHPEATELMRTSTRHLGSGHSANGSLQLQYRMPQMPAPDGNSVDIQEEQAKFAENNVQILASLRFLSGRFQSLTTAIKGE